MKSRVSACLLLVGVVVFLIIGGDFVSKRQGDREGESGGAAGLSSRSLRGASSHSRSGREKARSVEELTAEIDRVIDQFSTPNSTSSEMTRLRDELVGKWSAEEVESVCREWMIAEDGGIILKWTRGSDRIFRREMWVDPLFHRWGSLSPEAALRFVSEFEDTALEQTGTYDDTWAMNTPLSCAGERFSAVMIGWSSRDPFEAYRALKSGEAAIADPETFDLYLPTTIGGMFEHLAEKDSDFAFAEFRESRDDGVRAEMLTGISKALPTNHDFQSLFGDLRSEVKAGEKEVKVPLRGRLLARWLENDAEGAMTWYEGEEADWVMPASRRNQIGDDGVTRFDFSSPDKYPYFEDPLASALRYWFLRKPEQATVWLQDHRNFLPSFVSSGFVYVQAEDLRKVVSLTLTDREKELYFLSRAGEQGLGFLIGGDREEVRENLRELRLGEGLEERFFQKYLEENIDFDPFAVEEE